MIKTAQRAALATVWISVMAAAVLAAATTASPTGDMSWWYREPGETFWEGMPIGTGRLGAMVLGQVRSEVINLNDETLWSGGPYNSVREGGLEALPDIRRLILTGEENEAEELCWKIMGIPHDVQHYNAMSEWRLYFQRHDNVSDYVRELDMDRAMVRISYRIGDAKYQREIFASYPDQVIVMRLRCNQPGKISFSTHFTSIQPTGVSEVRNDSELVITGKTKELTEPGYGQEGDPYGERVIKSRMKWENRLKVIAQGGRVKATKIPGAKESTAAAIQVEEADEVVMIVAAATNLVDWNDVSADPTARCDQYMAAAKRPYQDLLKRHLDDYQPKFRACELFLGKNGQEVNDTTTRLANLKNGGEDPHFLTQYFQYARYLLLAAAREGTLAFNNHNLWLDNLEGRWAGRWTLDINLQECYFPVENTNLAELNDSMLLLTKWLSESGTRTAKELYGCRGWTASIGADIWMHTSPQCSPSWGIWPVGGSWLMMTLWDHYLFEPDQEYLKEIYPILKGSALFGLDFLIEDPKSGYLVTCPSYSPENDWVRNQGTDQEQRGRVTLAPTLDSQLLRDVFRWTIQASEVLDCDAELREQLKTARRRLPPNEIGRWGQLQEWLYDYDREDDTHRHLSHLYGFYQSNQITLRGTPELAEAVRVSLEHRSDPVIAGHTDVNKINMWARFEDPQRAYFFARRMAPWTQDSEKVPSMEGNQAIQGWAAGIAEMLLQSHASCCLSKDPQDIPLDAGGEIRLLPALPNEWPDGYVKGLRARGGFTVDIQWKDGKLDEAVVYSKLGGKCYVRYESPVEVKDGSFAVDINAVEPSVIHFDTAAGKSYFIRPVE
ncbi:glycoside hydrolase family 95 protein [Pirellulales bacterium]|nr:glycoside hydrolase family 95 protein [Pirellulales bacterium]